MPKYRIKKVIAHGRKTMYYPQVRIIFGIWHHLTTTDGFYMQERVAKFERLESAEAFIEDARKKYLDGSIKTIEYIYIKTGEPQ